MKIIINERQFKKLILREDSNEQFLHAKKIVNSNLLRRLEDQIHRSRSHNELFYELKRTVMKFISIIKNDFSVSSKELSIDIKELLKYIKRSLDNSRIINKGIGRNKIGQLLNIITQELNRFKSVGSQSKDTDNDGIPNRLDIDDDNDGVLDPNDKDSLNEQHNTDNLYAKLTDEHSDDLLEKIAKLTDEDKLEDLQHELSLGLHNKHNSNFMDTLNHNLHAHYDFKNNHLKLEFPHLGPHHDIEIGIEGSFGHHDSHGNEPINLELEPNFGATFKIPLHFHSKH